MRSMSHFKRLILWALISLLLHACAPGGGSMQSVMLDRGRPDKSHALLSIFMTLTGINQFHLGLVVEGLDVLAEDQWQPLSGEFTLDSSKIKEGQALLARAPIPVGEYSALRFRLKKAFMVKTSGQPMFLSLKQDALVIKLVSPIHVKAMDSASLFLTWNIGNSLKNQVYVRPDISVAPKLKHMVADLAYVACPDIDTVYIIRTDKNWVYDSFGVGRSPIYVLKHPKRPDQILYILTRGDSSIKIFSPAANHVIQSLTIPMTKDPVYMALAPNGRWAFILDRQGDYLVKVDLSSGGLLGRVRLGYSPNFILYIKEKDLLAISLGSSQSVLLVEPEQLKEVGRISTNSRPEGLEYHGGVLYIAEKGSNSILVYDLDRRSFVRRINVGFGPRRLLYGNGYLFVSNTIDGYLSVILPRQLGVARNIRLQSGIFELALNSTNRWLYVANVKAGTISFVDPTAFSVVGSIGLKTRPLGITIVR